MAEQIFSWLGQNPWILVPFLLSFLGWRISRQNEKKYPNWRE